MGFRRIWSVWFYSVLSAAVFVTLAAGLADAPKPTSTAVAATPATERPFDQSALLRAPVAATDLPPLRGSRVGNPDRRKVVMVPVTQAGALLTVDSAFALP